MLYKNKNTPGNPDSTLDFVHYGNVPNNDHCNNMQHMGRIQKQRSEIEYSIDSE